MKRILASYPDYGKAPADYLLEITEYIASLTIAEQSLICDPKTGVATRCKFLPTKAEMAEILAEHRAKFEQVRPAHTVYRRFEKDDWKPETTVEERKAHVRSVMGYNPGEVKKTAEPLTIKSSADLKTPSRPASKELRQLLTEQGWPGLEAEPDFDTPLMRKTAS